MISTNRVYVAVLYLLNKNNLGNLTAPEYNSYSQLAQQAIFESLFYDYSKWLVNKTNRRANSGYSNIPANIREMIDVFSTYSTTANFTYDSGDNLWSYTGNDFYRTIGLSLVNPQGKKVDVEEVSKNMINSLVNSDLSAPSVIYPICTKIGESYRVFPNVPTGYELELAFIRKPKAPRWTYIVLPNGDSMYNGSATDLQDFELPEALFEKLIVKILSYSGISLRENDIVQIANQEELKTNQTQS
jgi:hypothetical protein